LLQRAIYAAFRETTGTLTTHDVTIRVMASRGLNVSDVALGRSRTAFAYTIGVKGDRPEVMKVVPIEGDPAQPDTLLLRRDFFGGGLAD
jgi:hypothetical protein